MAGTALRGRLTWQVAKVAAVAAETASVRTITLDVPDWPGHQAGQHLDIRLTDEDGYVAERSYSIASAPGEPVAITVERLDDGEVSPYLTDELRAGDDLDLRGPSHRAGPGTCGGWTLPCSPRWPGRLPRHRWPTSAGRAGRRPGR